MATSKSIKEAGAEAFAAQQERLRQVETRVRAAIRSGENVLLWGPPETAKSHTVREESNRTNTPLTAFPVTRGASGQSLFGFFAPRGAEWAFTHGPFSRAALARPNGGILLLDDIHTAGPDLESALYSAADRHDVELVTGEIVKPGPAYRCIATSNESPESLPEAIASRFPIRIEVPAALPSSVAALPEYARKLMESGTPGIGLRQCWALSRLLVSHSIKDALDIVFGQAQASEIYDGLQLAKMAVL